MSHTQQQKMVIQIGSGSSVPDSTANIPTQAVSKSKSVYADLPSVSESFELDAADVIRVVEQFLQEQGLARSLRALQDETGVSHNSVDNIEKFTCDIQEGRWDRVLDALSSLSLPHSVAAELTEHICLELCEMKEKDTARALMMTSPSMQYLMDRMPERYARLQRTLTSATFDSSSYTGSRAKRRSYLVSLLKKELTQAPPNRLLTLISQALRWQQYTGKGIAAAPSPADYDLYTDSSRTSAASAIDDAWITQPGKVLNLSSGVHAEAVAFLPTAGKNYLLTGSSDGFLEVWDWSKGKLAKDLPYQAKEEFMLHAHAVSAVDVSRDAEVCVSASIKGEIKVWALATGACVRKIPDAHSGSVNSLSLSIDGTQALTAGEDGCVRVFGLRSGHKMCEMRAHDGAVRCVQWMASGALLSGGADGMLKSYTTDGTVKGTLRIGERAITCISAAFHRPDVVVVACGMDKAYVVDVETMKTLQTLTVVVQPNTPIPQLTHVAMSRSGTFVYATGSDYILYVFRVETGRIVHALKPHGQDILGLVQHPNTNVVATFSKDGSVKTWKC